MNACVYSNLFPFSVTMMITIVMLMGMVGVQNAKNGLPFVFTVTFWEGSQLNKDTFCKDAWKLFGINQWGKGSGCSQLAKNVKWK